MIFFLYERTMGHHTAWSWMVVTGLDWTGTGRWPRTRNEQLACRKWGRALKNEFTVHKSTLCSIIFKSAHNLSNFRKNEIIIWTSGTGSVGDWTGGTLNVLRREIVSHSAPRLYYVHCNYAIIHHQSMSSTNKRNRTTIIVHTFGTVVVWTGQQRLSRPVSHKHTHPPSLTKRVRNVIGSWDTMQCVEVF